MRRIMLEQALEVYRSSHLYRNEIARTLYKLGCVLQDSGKIEEGKGHIDEAEKQYRVIKASDPKESLDLDEQDYDRLVMFWSR
jgi:hypothetical protein